MFTLIATMRRGSSSAIPEASARYPTVEAARLGAAMLLGHERILRVVIVRNLIPPTFVEWAER
jgi:TRAP-type C4-dicarboxylate transport system permease small subunit